MAQVTLEIFGRTHTVGCGDGEEPRLIALSKYVDTKVRELASQVGVVGESRLLLLTCLTLADELGEAYHRAETGRQAGDADGDEARRPAPEVADLQARIAVLETRLAEREAGLAKDLERLADRLAAATERLAPRR